MEQSMCFLIIIFFGWTITSFICHFYAKLFLAESTLVATKVYGNVLYLSGMQISIILLSMYRENKSKSPSSKVLILTMHACATIATNWSIAISHAASTFAIKLMEPLTGAIAQKLILGVRLSCLQCLSIPLVIIGAVIFADESNHTTISISSGSILAFTSNIFLAFRNVYIKQKHLSNTNIIQRDNRLITDVFGISVTGIVFLLILTKNDISLKNFWYMYLLVTTSAVFHTTYTYISTVLVLKHFTVVGHAFGNILKRLIVIALLYVVGSRSATAWNFIGLIICTAGLMLYAGSKVDTSNKEIVYNTTETAFRYSDMAKWKNIILLVSMVITLLLLISQLQTYRLPCSHVLFSRENKVRTVYNFPDVSKEQSYESEINPLSLSQSLNFSLEEFYATDLTTYPEQANKLSPHLTKRADVIAEAQRIHMNIFSTLLKGYKYAMLFDYSPSENKGDAAIVVGEATLLRRFNINVVFACSTAHCGKHLDYAEKLSKNYSSTELVILLHGGGNIIGYHYEDKRRFEEIPHFKAFNIIMFPQSIFHRGDTEHIELCKKVYSSHPSLTFIWRDSVSYKLGKRLFPNVRSLLSPDIVFQLGPVKRFMDPTQDILWIKRTDAETPVYDAPKSAGKYRMHVADWKLWSTPKGTSPMEDSYLMTANGMMFLSRGRVVVTDRLHGFILCTLLNIPHVFIDNKQHKLSNYHNTWTHGLENLIMASSSADAVVQAQYLLKKLDKELPQITGFYKNTGY